MADASELLTSYRDGTAGAGDKLVRKYVAATGKQAAAASDAAQASYTEAMRDPKVLARRQKELRKVTEEQMNSAMRDKGGSNYATSTGASGQKWVDNALPYVNLAESTAANLPPRSRDPMVNVDKRVKPIVKALHDLKEQR